MAKYLNGSLRQPPGPCPDFMHKIDEACKKASVFWWQLHFPPRVLYKLKLLVLSLTGNLVRSPLADITIILVAVLADFLFALVLYSGSRN
ncbi:hypothetical protein TorRG33x02_259580 [Trema orientale]|uniref:Uncharacterized protein n=1 Tax=Trema orientale TaxID=63057 RepID=A0A2P5D7R5_TREOI|nr:hypothetical protein TorRG33x02_259580 [Trema orientale]